MANCREFALDDLAAIVAIPVWKQCGTGMSVESLAGLVQDEDSIVVGSFVRAGSLIPILHATGKVSDTVSDTVAGRLHTVTVKCDVDIRNPEVVPFLRRLQQTPSHLILTSHNGDRFGVYATEYTYLCETEQDDEKTPLSIRIQSVMGLQRIIDVESIVLSATSLSIQPHGTATLSATVLPSNATDKDVEWHSGNPGIATVDANGKVTAMALGSCVITCTAKDGSGKTATCSCEVANVLVEDISLSPASLSLSPRDTQKIDADISPSDATNKNVLWRSDDTSVADVDADGNVTAVSAGACHIICEATDGSGVSESCECSVSNRMVTGITLSKASLSLPVGESEVLLATLTPDNVTNADLIWSSSNESVALVNPMGMVTAVAEGSCTIVCMAADGSGVSSSCSCDVVEQPVTNITLSAQSLRLLAGEKKTIVPTILPSYASNKTLVWSSSDTDVATVDGSGEVTAVAEGSCTITCTASDGGGASAACSLNVYAEYVDLGLPSHTLWATRNVGAEDPSEHGDYFAWGETEPKESYTEDNYKHASGPQIINSLTKYNNDSRYGVVDNKTELEPEDDAAAENLGEDWLMPNGEQVNELIDSDHTTIERASIDGVEGFMVTSKSNGKSLFLPVSGFRDGKVTGNPLSGYYWLKVLNEQFSPRGRMLQLYGISSCSIYDFLRSYGLCIRPVFGAYLFLNQSFIFRQTSNGALNAKIKNAYIERIKGNTLAWNQLVQNGNFQNGTTGWRAYGSNGSLSVLNNTLTYTITTLGNNQYSNAVTMAAGITTPVSISGHVFIVSYDAYVTKETKLNSFYFGGKYSDVVVQSGWNHITKINRSETNGASLFIGLKNAGSYNYQVGDSISIKNVMCIDLTLIYGAGNEPSTPEEFEADYLRWFGKPLTYEPYDAGSLRNVQMQGLKTTGFNQWDEEWELGGINANTGENTSSVSLLRSKNTIPVLSQMSYCIHVGSIQGRNIKTFYYDSDNNYIGASSSWLANNEIFSTPDNCHYIKFHIAVEYYGSSSYNNDICINISDTNKNGTYEPYEEHNVSVPVTTLTGKVNGEGESVVIFPDGMKGVGDVKDEIKVENGVTKAIKRIGRVDLGSFTYSNYTYIEGSTTYPWGFEQAIAIPNRSISKTNMLCQSYITAPTLKTIDKSVVGHSSSSSLYIVDSSFIGKTGTEIKTALENVYLYYELAEPIEYVVDDFSLPASCSADRYGTEEVVPVSGEESIAPTFDVAYK